MTNLNYDWNETKYQLFFFFKYWLWCQHGFHIWSFFFSTLAFKIQFYRFIMFGNYTSIAVDCKHLRGSAVAFFQRDVSFNLPVGDNVLTTVLWTDTLRSGLPVILTHSNCWYFHTVADTEHGGCGWELFVHHQRKNKTFKWHLHIPMFPSETEGPKQRLSVGSVLYMFFRSTFHAS